MNLRSFGIRLGTNSLFFFTAIALSITAASATQTFTGTIAKLSDGDTLQFLPTGQTKVFKVRMIAIDTAETHLGVPGGVATQGYWGDMGADQLAKYISIGDEAVLEVYGEDKYQRKLGRIIKNGEDINLKMLASGWASLFVLCEAGAKCQSGNLSDLELKAYRQACNSAVQKGLGLFDPARPVPELPFVFRAREQNLDLTKFVANLAKKTYAKPNQYASVPICDRLFYLNENDVLKNGFRNK